MEECRKYLKTVHAPQVGCIIGAGGRTKLWIPLSMCWFGAIFGLLSSLHVSAMTADLTIMILRTKARCYKSLEVDYCPEASDKYRVQQEEDGSNMVKIHDLGVLIELALFA